MQCLLSVGDPRRPYPTDGEMRQGLLAQNFEKLKESYLNQNNQALHNPGVSTPSNTQIGL